MTAFTTSVAPPGFVTVSVSSAPKRAGEAWFDRAALTWDQSARNWRTTAIGCGIAIADGAAASASTAASIRVRPCLLVRRQGRGSSFSAPGIARLETKASGVVFAAGGSVYRQCDPSVVDYGTCYPTAGTGRREIGLAALAAISSDAAVLVWHSGSSPLGIPHVPMSALANTWTMNIGSASGGGVTATAKSTATLDPASAAVTAGGVVLRGHSGEITASLTAGGAGKTFLGKSANAAAAGGLIEYGWYSNQYENDIKAFLALADRLDCVILTCPDITDAADIAARSSLYAEYQVSQSEILDNVGNSDRHTLRVFGFSDYEPTTLLEHTAYAHGEFACAFPFSQLPASFLGKIPADTVLVFGGRAKMGAAGSLANAVAVDIRHNVAPGTAVANPRTWRNISEVLLSSSPIATTNNSVSDFIRRSVKMASGRYVRQLNVGPQQPAGGYTSNPLDGGPFGRPRRAVFSAFSIDHVNYNGVRVIVERLNPDATVTVLATIELINVFQNSGTLRDYYSVTVNNPTWLHPLELRNTLQYRWETRDIFSGGTWGDDGSFPGGPYTAWLDPFTAMAPAWRVPRMYVAGSPSSYIGLEGYVETGLDWPEPSWTNSISLSTATVGLDTQITVSGTASCSVTETGVDRLVSAATVKRTFSLYDPTTGLWLNAAPGSGINYVNTFWHTTPHRFLTFETNITIRLRNPGPGVKTLQWTMHCAQAVTQRGGPVAYGTTIRGTVDIPAT